MNIIKLKNKKMKKENKWEKVTLTQAWNGKDANLQKGDELIGTYEALEQDVGDNHSNIYTFKTKAGLVSVWGSTVLDVRLKNIEIGDQVKIVYLGKAKSEKVKGREYHNYDVYHRKPVYEDIPVIEEEEVKSFQEQIEGDQT